MTQNEQIQLTQELRDMHRPMIEELAHIEKVRDAIAAKKLIPSEDTESAIDAMTSHGTKYDNNKPRFDLIPPKAEKLLAEVLSYGANKYAPDNWRKLDDLEARYMAAAQRHINAHRSGERMDEESGLPHLAHAMCCMAFILEVQ